MSKILVTGGSGFIGSYLIEELVRDGHEALNLDLRPPPSHKELWRKVDITQVREVEKAFSTFGPDSVVHLAARTDTLSDKIEEYADNWIGTEVTSLAALAAGSDRYISTSTQYVHATDKAPESDLHYSPFTAYGQSKVESEHVTRRILEGSATKFVITRPTNIWGPRHPRYPIEFWRVLEKGWYAHPVVKPPVQRAYGYVGTVTWQLRHLISGSNFPSGRVLYLGDPQILLDEWVDEFSRALTGRPARRVSARALTSLGRLGDILSWAGIRPPLTSARVANMVNSSEAPMARTIDLLGPSPWSLEAAVTETVDWLRGDARGPG